MFTKRWRFLRQTLLYYDGNASTAASATSCEFVFDLGRTIDINKIVIKKQANVGGTTYNYWGDWVLAVGAVSCREARTVKTGRK